MVDSQANENAPDDRAVLKEQLELLSRHSTTIYAGTLIVSALMVIALYGHMEFSLLITWAGFVWALTAVRAGAFYWLSRQPGLRQSAKFLTRFFVAGSAVSGVLWGLGGILFYRPESPLLIAFVLIILAGMTAGSVASLSSYRPAYVAYAVPAMLPIGVQLLIERGATYSVLGVAALVFLLVNLAYSRNINAMVVESIRLRFRNLGLLGTLKEQRAQAEQARDDAERANVTKSQFLAAASHDLRQPVHALGLLLHAAAATDDDEERDELFRKLESSTEALNGLFEALLDISRLDAGVVDVEIVDFALQDIVSRLAEETRTKTGEKNLDLSFDDEDVLVRSDPFLLERILRNLLSNAVKFTPQGRISLTLRQQNDVVLVDISDTGPGIATEDRERIFLEFEQLDNPERDRRKGLGLGLAIVRRLCRLLDVSLEVISEPGSGATFRLAVPVGDSAAVTQPADEYQPPNSDMVHSHVLLIEDEINVVEATTAILEAWGCRVGALSSGADAIRYVRDAGQVPDVVLADYRLRNGENGVEIVKQLRSETGSALQAIIVTGDTAADRLVETVDSGFTVLHKPVSPAELRVAMAKALRSRSA